MIIENKQQTTTDASFRLRIGSLGEAISVEFAFAVLPYLASASERDLTPIQITETPYKADVPFIHIRNLGWRPAFSLLDELPARGINTLILSENFLAWDNPSAFINDDLKHFEDKLATLNLTVITVERYSDCQRQTMPAKFKNAEKWHWASLSEIFPLMVNGYKNETLCCPYGNLPYFLIGPQQNSIEFQSAKEIPALLGFQPWQYDKVLNRWPTSTYPLQHAVDRINGEPVPQTGSIPMRVCINE